MSRHIVITGGTGFIGQALCHRLHNHGHRLTVFSRRSDEEVERLCGRVRVINRLSAIPGLGSIDAVINLAGEGIAEKRWTRKRKQALWDSRVGLTEELVSHLKRCPEAPDVLISGSAVGYYGDQGDATVTESTAPTHEFTHRMCNAWEQAALAFEDTSRVCLSRTGLVVGRGGGFLQQMLPLFRIGLGGRLGKGTQYMPWIHRYDMVEGLVHLLENPELSGPFNMTAPNPVTNAEFTRILGHVLNRPAVLPAPSPALKLALGEMARLLLTGQKAIPERLLSTGYEFHYPELEAALKEAIQS
jgi:hypothetical protein